MTQNWHGSGTCKVAPLCEGGVVDPGLGVHGVEALKIADLSVVPVNVAVNTVNLALLLRTRLPTSLLGHFMLLLS